MAYTLKYDMASGKSVIEVTVENERALFKAGHFLANLPRFCPFDGKLTRLHYSTDDKDHEYFGVCSSANERLKFRFGVRENAAKDLYPSVWTYWEDIDQGNGETRRYTWHWVNGEWREYALEVGSKKDKDKIVHMDRIRRKMFPRLDPLLPLYTEPVSDEPMPRPSAVQADVAKVDTVQAPQNQVTEEAEVIEARKQNPNKTSAERTALEAAIREICSFGGDNDVLLSTPWIVAQWTSKHKPQTNRIDFLTDVEMATMASDINRLRDKTREACKVFLDNQKKQGGTGK